MKPTENESERGERPGHRIKGREEDLVEDQGRGRAEDEEVVPLDHRSDEAGEGHLAGRVEGRPTAGLVHGIEAGPELAVVDTLPRQSSSPDHSVAT